MPFVRYGLAACMFAYAAVVPLSWWERLVVAAFGIAVLSGAYLQGKS
jgi:hypothetical protein